MFWVVDNFLMRKGRTKAKLEERGANQDSRNGSKVRYRRAASHEESESEVGRPSCSELRISPGLVSRTGQGEGQEAERFHPAGGTIPAVPRAFPAQGGWAGGGTASLHIPTTSGERPEREGLPVPGQLAGALAGLAFDLPAFRCLNPCPP